MGRLRRIDLTLAYLFWLPSLTGIAGLHRFYLGKPVSGLLYLVTVGFFGLGTLYDALTMPRLVRRARLEEHLDQLLDEEEFLDDSIGPSSVATRKTPFGKTPNRWYPGNVERSILALAAERHGIVTPGRVALAASVSAEKARAGLDRLVRQGFADVRVSREGMMLYIFPEFIDKAGRDELDSLT